MQIAELHDNIASVCPIDGVAIADPSDKSTWRIDYKDSATAKQRAAAKAVVEAFDIDAPERRLVPRRVIVERLQAAGKLAAARAALDAADLYTRERWNTRDAIYTDDESALTLIKGIGADPATILAPE